jgi:hypothetical protein
MQRISPWGSVSKSTGNSDKSCYERFKSNQVNLKAQTLAVTDRVSLQRRFLFGD